jgi:cyclic lactone autoinducer peptide
MKINKGDGIMSKKLSNKLGEVLAKGVLAVSKLSANSTCFFVVHQPKLPKKVKSLRKF